MQRLSTVHHYAQGLLTTLKEEVLSLTCLVARCGVCVNSPKHEVPLLSNNELIKHTSDVKLIGSIPGFINMK